MIYLDHAATTPVPRPVADAMYQSYDKAVPEELVYSGKLKLTDSVEDSIAATPYTVRQ